MRVNGLLEKETTLESPSWPQRTIAREFLRNLYFYRVMGNKSNPSHQSLVSYSYTVKHICTHSLIPIQFPRAVSSSSPHSPHAPSVLTTEWKFPWKEIFRVTFCNWRTSSTMISVMFLALFTSFLVAGRIWYSPTSIITSAHITLWMLHRGVKWVDPNSANLLPMRHV